MFFGKKEKVKCESCSSKVENKFSFCPYCGFNLLSKENEMRDFGMLGRNDAIDEEINKNVLGGFGITEKIIGSLVNNLAKSLDKQIREMEKTEVRSLPNGIKIKINGPLQPAEKKSTPQKEITSAQLEKMASLPRATAKTSSVRRLSDKVIYELITPGVESNQDIFVSKLEQGYEIKAIGSKKIYIKNIPISLPLKKCIVDKNKVLVEFKLEEDQ
ncbi:zinc ribbon domain-containing protein [Candidatus Pacearchaeota archaeon]|nr:zinc ribbon domain-containing protein [Candidatus Pacearchaeota archaeon]